MTQPDRSTVEVKPAASFSEVLENKGWGPDLRKAAEAGSVVVIEAHEQPAVVVAPAAPKPRRPR